MSQASVTRPFSSPEARFWSTLYWSAIHALASLKNRLLLGVEDTVDAESNREQKDKITRKTIKTIAP